MKKIVSAVVSGLSILLMPAFAFAATVTNADQLLNTILKLLDRVTIVIVALAVVFFIYGILKFFLSTDAEDKSAARSYMIYGIIALFVMVSVWGLVNLLSGTFQFNNTNIPVPKIPS